MSELHTDDEGVTSDLINQDIAQTDTGTAESGPELATGGDENPGEINQDAVQERINKATHQRHKAERATAAETKRANELQAQLDAIENAKPIPTITPMPDRFDASDEEWQAAQDRQAQEHAAVRDHESGLAARQNAQAQRQHAAQQAQNAELQKHVTSYQASATGYGISQEQMMKDETAVVGPGSIGLDRNVAEFILKDAKGPLIIAHLAANPGEHHELSRLSPIDAAIRIRDKILPKFASTKSKISSAPDPLNRVKGSGTAPKKRGVEGTKYE